LARADDLERIFALVAPLASVVKQTAPEVRG
jgi:hypothetical protein